MERMKKAGKVGIDVNKKNKPKVPEMGGIAAMLGFVIAALGFAGIMKIFSIYQDYAIFLVIAALVFLISSIVGFIDDLGIIRRREKALLIALAAAPLVIYHPIIPIISLPFGVILNFSGTQLNTLIFWLIIVPFGILACANAFNMSAGYNGLESGIPIITSSVAILILSLKHGSVGSIAILACLFGSSLGLFLFNKYPARMFVGDVGTLSFGAVFATAIIFGDIILLGIILIIPAFYEATATFYYAMKKIERRDACFNPIILKNSRLKPPKGAERYTLAYYILNSSSLKEEGLVNRILSCYFISGLCAIGLVTVEILL